MTTQEITSTSNAQDLSTSVKNQYALWQILGIWFAAGAPMWILGRELELGRGWTGQ